MVTILQKEHIKAISELGKKFSDATIFMHEAIAKKAGLSGTDHKYLGLIMGRGTMSAGELSSITGLTTGAVTGLIDRLEKRRLVKRKFDHADRRKIMIVPNRENTAKLLGPSFSDLQNRIVNHFAGLGKEEAEIIEKYLLATIGIMEEVTNRLKFASCKPTPKQNKA